MFEGLTETTIAKLDADSQAKLRSIIDDYNNDRLNPTRAIKYFSDISITMARQSYRDGKAHESAQSIRKAFNNLIGSDIVNRDTKAKMREYISDTTIDLRYACGEHNMTSLRMMPMIMPGKAENV